MIPVSQGGAAMPARWTLADVVVGDVEVVRLAGDHHGSDLRVAVHRADELMELADHLRVHEVVRRVVDSHDQDTAPALGVEYRHGPKPRPID
jgi:hypothetical protein